MLRKWFRRMSERVFEFTNWNRSRCECFANIVCAAVSARSVRLDDLAAHIPGKAKFASKTRRLQLFFQYFDLDYNVLALLLVTVLGKLLGEKWLLAVDRTNWRRRENEVNLLTLAVCLGDVAIPLFWTDLGYKGNSNTKQRIDLMKKFISVFGSERIRAITADREFVGEEWFRWLKNSEIPFVLRVKDNFQVPTTRGRQTDACNCFRNLAIYEQRVLGLRKVCGVELTFDGLRLPCKEFVILVSYGIDSGDMFSAYRDRWQIETLFEKLKGHGFDFEGSRLRGEGKSEKMLAALALAAAWCYAFGRWHVESVTPLKNKTHGRLEKSVFRIGLDILRQVLSGCAAELARFCRVANSLLKPTPHTSILNIE